jgi:hypothetical protein
MQHDPWQQARRHDMTGDLAAVPKRDEIHVWTIRARRAGRRETGWLNARRCPPRSSTAPGDIASSTTACGLSSLAQRFVYLLAGYLGIDPASLRIVSGRRGKPQLAPGASSWLRFNIVPLREPGRFRRRT